LFLALLVTLKLCERFGLPHNDGGVREAPRKAAVRVVATKAGRSVESLFEATEAGALEKYAQKHPEAASILEGFRALPSPSNSTK
jgi:hypothetical protein